MNAPILFIDEEIPHDVQTPMPKWDCEHTLPCGCVIRSSKSGVVHIATCGDALGWKEK